jgi:hypothetical protein
MSKQTVVLETEEWQQIMGLMAEAPWRIANPLLMKVGEQLRVQQPNNNQQTNSQDMPAAQGDPTSSRAN